jgi:hypothetical protein
MDLESRTDHASDQTDSLWTRKRKALCQQASEGLRQSRERYIATTRPVLERKFRHEHPELNDTEVETLVNEALATDTAMRRNHDRKVRPGSLCKVQ